MEGKAKAESASGGINITNAHSAEATTQFGSVTLKHLRENAYAETESGDIAMEDVGGKATALSTGAGSIAIMQAQSVNATANVGNVTVNGVAKNRVEAQTQVGFVTIDGKRQHSRIRFDW